MNVVGASSKSCDMLQEKHAAGMIEALKSGDKVSGRGLNQSTTLTLWLISVINVFSSIIDEVEKIVDGKSSYKQIREANNLLGIIQSFKSVFSLYLMR